MEIPSGKVLAKPPVASLGCLIVILNAKRRQLGIRVSIEPRNSSKYISRGRPLLITGRQYNTKQFWQGFVLLLRGHRPNYDTQ